MKSEPLISIITVVFNGGKTLEQTIQSVISQSYKHIEYIIIDGLSTDGTLDIIKKYEDQISYWVSESDNGLYDAMNKGILRANGEIIGMINSDDWYETCAVDLIVKAYKENPEKKIFHGDRFDVSQEGAKTIKRFHSSDLKFLFYGMTYNHPSMFVHKKVYEYCSYDTSLIALSDYQFVLTQFFKNKSMFHYIPTAYVNYRLDGVSAQMGIFHRLKEGFASRKNAGLNIIYNFISLIIRLCVFLGYKLFISKK